jgi:hypothetical protein
MGSGADAEGGDAARGSAVEGGLFGEVAGVESGAGCWAGVATVGGGFVDRSGVSTACCGAGAVATGGGSDGLAGSTVRGGDARTEARCGSGGGWVG